MQCPIVIQQYLRVVVLDWIGIIVDAGSAEGDD